MRGFTAWARRGGFDIGVSSAKLTKAMEELEIDISGVGSTTLQLEVEDRGLEPDECYYIQNESRVRNEEDLDLTRDPPPDLAIEVDITRSSLDRAGIYASLRIPEIWRYDGKTLRIYRLARKGHYNHRKKHGAAEVASFGVCRLPPPARHDERHPPCALVPEVGTHAVCDVKQRSTRPGATRFTLDAHFVHSPRTFSRAKADRRAFLWFCRCHELANSVEDDSKLRVVSLLKSLQLMCELLVRREKLSQSDERPQNLNVDPDGALALEDT